jgi:hypothetical protein
MQLQSQLPVDPYHGAGSYPALKPRAPRHYFDW